jgi:hypothetical protein
MSYMKPILPDWWPVAASLLAVVLFFCAALWWIPSAKCNQTADVTGKPTQWRLLSGCYVKVDGRWIPVGSWRGEQER